MITASEVNQTAKTCALNDIEKQIKEAAANGRNSTIVYIEKDWKERSSIISILRENGYCVDENTRRLPLGWHVEVRWG